MSHYGGDVLNAGESSKALEKFKTAKKVDSVVWFTRQWRGSAAGC